MLDLPALPHLRQMHSICFHSGSSLLRTSCRIPSEVNFNSRATELFYLNFLLLSRYHLVEKEHDSGEGSHQSGCSEDRTPGAMARAITVHADTKKVMYFA